MTVAPDRAARARTLTYRPVTADELATCAGIWRTSINDYIERLGQEPIPDEVGPLLRLYGHLLATDPTRFVAAFDGPAVVAFAAAVQRERLWFLSMCFVLPEWQGAGIGRELLIRVGPTDADPPDTVRATATDSAQPISNALYASLGIVPRVPLLNLIGLPARPTAFGPLPSGIAPIPFEVVAGGDGAEGHRRLAATSTRSIGSSSGSAIRSIIDSCGGSSVAAGCTTDRTGRRSATATRVRVAGSARSRSATPRCSRRSWAT